MNILTVVLLTFTMLSNVDLSTVRTNFEKAENSKEYTQALYNNLKSYNNAVPLLQAYKGAAFALQARYTTDRKHKKELFIAGAKDIEAAVKAETNNVEIRLVRLIIQENAPNILKYKMNIDEDKQMILTNFAKQPKAVKDLIKRYATRHSTIFTAAELSKLSN